MPTKYDEYILKPDTLLQGRYRIENVIGEGGFGITYAAVNEKIDMTVAIKELYCREYIQRDVTESNEIHITYASQKEIFEQAKKRFLQEARTLSGFSNENGIVKILDYFEENGTAYIVMDYLRGNTLDKYLEKNGPMDWKDMLEKIKPLVATLERVHNRGIVHRDISASNIIVLENGSLCLVDFGTVKDTLKGDGTKTTTVFTKQGYTPIEQYAQKGNVGSWSDVYALCAVCYECLTGVRPPDSLQRSIFDEYKTVKEKGKDIPDQLEALLQKGLAVKVEDRYANMNELLEVMNGVSTVKKKAGVKKVIIALIIACMLAGAAGTYFYFSYREEIMFGFEDTETFLAVRDKDVSIDDYQKDFDAIEERMRILVGDGAYIWEEDGDSLRGVLPLACFGNTDPREAIRDLVIRPGKWTINGVEIEPKNVREIKFTDNKKNTLGICLTEDTPEEIQSALESLCEDKEAVLSVDAGYSNHLSLHGKMDTPLTFSWDLEKQWKEKNMRELFLYNISHSCLNVGFSLYTQIQADWETRNSNTEFGKKQCNIDELDSNTISIEYWEGYNEDLTEGTTTDFVISLKKRLDILNLPYAIGREKHHKQRIVLCVNQKDYNEDLFSFLLKDHMDFAIRDSWGQVILDNNALECLEFNENGGNSFVAARVDTESMKEAEKQIKKMKEKRGNEYFLTVNDIRILKGDLSLREDNVLRFDEINMDNREINDRNRKVVDMINFIISEKDASLNVYDMFTSQYSTAKECVSIEPEVTRDNLRFNTEKENFVVKEIKKILKDYEVESLYDYERGEENLVIRLPDNIYAETVSDTDNFLNQISEIMEVCRLQDGTLWTGITIGVKSRYEERNYAGKISFSRYWSERDCERPYSISLIGYEEKEAAWLKDISKKMKADERFQGYEFDFVDYSDYYIY